MKRRTKEIRRLMLESIEETGRISPSKLAKTFDVSRQAITKNLHELLASGVIEKTNLAQYPLMLVPIKKMHLLVPVDAQTQEHKIWSESIAPLFTELSSNVRDICYYGFTEMFNNVIDHSQAKLADLLVTVDALIVRMSIQDHGIGIWRKLQDAFILDDPRHAVLELTKGKLTTDPKRHTGEGIFFTSRMFDKFVIASDRLTFSYFREGDDDWLFDMKDGEVSPGTQVTMILNLDSQKTPRDIFDRFSANDDFGFSKTQLAVQLAKYEGDHLVSRSQAKRILHRLDKFKEVYLDFRDVTEIGQAFADEIFRVFKNDHPLINLKPVNLSEDVAKMVQRALNHEP